MAAVLIQKCHFKPILINNKSLRKGILLTLTNQEGKTARSEISPLPGYSQETVEEALKQLESLKRRILTTWWTKQAISYLENLVLYPSVYFGIEAALLDLLDPLPKDLPCAQYALLLGSPDEIMKRAEKAAQEGFREAKIKLVHLSLDTAHQVADNLKEQFHLRLDLNRKWREKQPLAFCSKYSQDQFEYIEEPIPNPEKLIHFPYPFALDETLRETRNLSPFLELKALKALIIKPTLIYPILSFLTLGKKVVFTSSFEGPVGITQIQRLIGRLKLGSTHHGLDTLRYS